MSHAVGLCLAGCVFVLLFVSLFCVFVLLLVSWFCVFVLLFVSLFCVFFLLLVSRFCVFVLLFVSLFSFTFWAVAISTRVVADADISAFVASIDMPAQSRSSALF